MDRRTFVKGTFGLVVLAAGASLGAVALQAGEKTLFTTPLVEGAEAAAGPVMQAGIELVEARDVVYGRFEGMDLFTVNATGAKLIEFADGVRTLDEIASCAAAAGLAVAPVDVAGFFIELCEAGFTQNTVLVNLYEITA